MAAKGAPKRPRVTNTNRKRVQWKWHRGSPWTRTPPPPTWRTPTLCPQALTPGGPLGNQFPGQTLGSRQFPDRHTPLPAGNTMCTLLLSDPTPVPLRKAERSFAAPSSAALSDGQGPRVVCLLPDPTCARRGRCALTRPDDRGWPSRSRLPPGTQLPKSPPDTLSPPSLARSPPGEPRKRKLSRGNDAGRAQAPRRAREKLQHKRPMTGRAPATGPGSSPSSERSGPAQPAARRGARRALLPGQECAARARPHAPRGPPEAHRRARDPGTGPLPNALPTSSRRF